eukprot:11221462-Lingulodinium_polyedra.AAC.1
MKLCCHRHNNKCSRTGRPHVALCGCNTAGVFLTKQAQEYPLRFCHALVGCFDDAFQLRKSKQFSAAMR